MENFEKSFENMDVRSEYVEQTMNSSTTAAMPEDEVNKLMEMVADEHGLKMADTFGSASVAQVAGARSQQEAGATAMPAGGGGAPLSGAAEDDLEERLRKLRGS